MPLTDRWHELLSGYSPERLELPDGLKKVVSTQEDVRGLFNVAGELWREVFDHQYICEALDILETSDADSEDFNEALKTIKAMRKPANILMSGFLLFDRKHFAPYEHWWVVKMMGAVNDYAREEVAEEFVDGLKMSIASYETETNLARFSPDTPEGFELFLTQTLDVMQQVTNTASSTDVKLLHGLRKSGTRLIMNLFQLSGIASGREDHKQAFYFFKSLDEELGNLHDEVVEARVLNKMAEEELVMSVPQALKDRIHEGINYLREQWDLGVEEGN